MLEISEDAFAFVGNVIEFCEEKRLYAQAFELVLVFFFEYCIGNCIGLGTQFKATIDKEIFGASNVLF